MNKRNVILAVAVTAVATVGLLGGLTAVQADSRGGPMMAHFRDRHDDRSMRGDGRNFGPGGHDMMSRLCSPRRDAMLAAGIAYVGATLTFTPEQTAAWTALTEKLHDGSAKVGEQCTARAAEKPAETSIDRLAHMEQGLTNALTIVQDVRPAYDAFYATLTAEQKDTLEGLLPQHRFGRGDGPGQRGHRHGDRHGQFGSPSQDDGDQG